MNAVIAFALRRRVLIVLLLLFLFGIGIASFVRLNIEAYPDPVPPLVDVITQNSGQSAEEIERYITIPIEIQMAGIPHVTTIRTISLFGLSDVKLQFTYDFTYDEAQQWVINRLSQLAPLPNGALPQISPWSPIGEIYRYRVVGPPGYSPMDLKTIEDWILERRFKAVPGVIDVNGWGGKTKAYQITVNLDRLISYGLTLPQVLQVLNNSNINVGGQTVNFGPQAAIVRGVALIHSMDQIRDTMIAATNGVPVRIGDIANVSVGNLPRLGIAGQDDDDDIVQGIVLMRRGEQSMPTIERVQDEVSKINSSGILPPGVHIERIYDRSELINITTRTVLHNMLFGIVLIFFVQWLFLGNLRSALIVSTTIPFALFFAIILLVVTGQSANLLSVGAIDFGLIVDATVIMVENIFRRLSQPPDQRFARSTILHRTGHISPFRGSFATIFYSAVEVNQAIFFSAAIIIAGFVPLFTMSGVEGHIFGPMAKTYAYAIAGGLIATFTVSPALASILLPERVNEVDTFIVRWLHALYRPVLGFALKHRPLTLAGAAAMLGLAAIALPRLGLEFLPKLEEGNFWIRATLPPSISLEEANGYVNRMRGIIKSYPEVITVVSQNGRPDDGTDATGFFNAEFYAPLKPFDTWPSGVDKEKLTDEMNSRLQEEFPGVEFNFSQNIEDNVEEAASGVKGENSVKLFGNDLATLEKTAAKIKQVMSTVSGITDLAVLNSLGQPTVEVDIDRARAARYGLAPGDINSTITAAIGGQAAGNLYEEGSDRNFPMMVRLAPKYRESLDAIRRITIGANNPSGSGVVPIPLADVAEVKLVSGASFIYRENQQRYIPIKFSVRGRDLGGAVLEAQQKIAREAQLPSGYRLEWVGEFGELQDAIGRLAIVVPLSIVLICLLLFLNFGSVIDMLLAASVMPMALIGGIFALTLTGTPFSVSAAIGFVALFGIAAMDGIIVIAYFNRLLEGGMHRAGAILRTGEVQMRPVIMTCVAACVGLLPAAVSTGIGSQVQKPLALVVVGGILLAPVLILLVLPVLIDLCSRRRSLEGAEEEALAVEGKRRSAELGDV
ncbi:MAG TPA: CusA/CzcA family heavy metal efflux RND transporter [Stellaceae bacterium]|jgi:cobalt-zinc-cadmium resistance protein CzcA|nr:CusA/CzcA family heavy metal efflux RND transporter [Stellaceae bacterium]